MSWNNFDNSMQNEGGFMNTSVNAGNGSENSNIRRGQNIVPVMIAHLLRHGEQINLWGTPVKNVTFLAIVKEVEAMSTKVSFMLQDETGTIKGIKWLDGDKAEYESPVQLNSYARVYGYIREQNDDKYVLILNIQPMENLNELTTHLMEVTLVTLEGSKGESQGRKIDATSNQFNQSVQGNGNSVPGLNPQQNMVLDIIQNSESEYGAERDEIKSKVPQSLVSKVDEILDFLSAEGHIYTTKTDDFFKAI